MFSSQRKRVLTCCVQAAKFGASNQPPVGLGAQLRSVAIRQFGNGCRKNIGRIATGSGGIALGISLFGSKGESSSKTDQEQFKVGSDAHIIHQADVLYEAFLVENLYKLLVRHSGSANAEILWRLARATCEMAKRKNISKDERKQFMYEAYEYAKQALDLEPRSGISAVHKWYAIMLNYIGDLEGTKASLTNAPKVREHFEKAVELNPKDGTSWHLLGVWYFSLADLPGYQRTLAQWIFGEVPAATFDQALEYFLKAEEVEPDFYSANLLYIGKIYLKKENKQKAIDYLTRAAAYPMISPDDMQTCAEAHKLLEGLI